MRKLILFLIILHIGFSYCNTPNKKKHKKLKLTEYKIAIEWVNGGSKNNSDNNNELDYDYIYVINTNDGRYYYYTSDSKLTNFSKISWIKTKEDPLKDEEEETIDEVNEITVDFDESGILSTNEEDISSQETETTDGESDSDSGSGDSGSGDSGSGGGGDGD